MNPGFRLTPEAQFDLDEIADFLVAEAGSSVAVKVVTAIRESFRELAAIPGMGHYHEELLDQRHKFWNVYSYLVVYRWQESPILILAVIHGARDLGRQFQRRGIE